MASKLNLSGGLKSKGKTWHEFLDYAKPERLISMGLDMSRPFSVPLMRRPMNASDKQTEEGEE